MSAVRDGPRAVTGDNLMDKVLRVENLSREGILSRITFEMESGEMLAVMGPSGSGKSTLLYHAAGMIRPSEGEIWLEDKNQRHERGRKGENTAAPYGICVSADEHGGRIKYSGQYPSAGGAGKPEPHQKDGEEIKGAAYGKGKDADAETFRVRSGGAQDYPGFGRTAPASLYLPEHDKLAKDFVCRRTDGRA